MRSERVANSIAAGTRARTHLHPGRIIDLQLLPVGMQRITDDVQEAKQRGCLYRAVARGHARTAVKRLEVKIDPVCEQRRIGSANASRKIGDGLSP